MNNITDVYQKVRDELTQLGVEGDDKSRRTMWIVPRVIGVARSDKAIDLFLVGPQLQTKSNLIRRHLDYAMWEIYERKHLEVMEVRDRLLYAIKKLYPDRTSEFATKLAQVKEPMISEQYSVVSFNDHPDTTFEDIMKVIEEAKV